MDGKMLVLLQVNRRNIYNKNVHFWKLIDKQSWLSEEFNNVEVFRDDYKTFRKDCHTRGDGVFICVKN